VLKNMDVTADIHGGIHRIGHAKQDGSALVGDVPRVPAKKEPSVRRLKMASESLADDVFYRDQM